jgi:hypothetical protein
MMEHGACDAHSHTLSCFSTAEQRSSVSLQNEDLNNVDWHPLPADITTNLQNMYATPLGDETTPQDMLQYFPGPAPATIKQPEERSSITAKGNPLIHQRRKKMTKCQR